MLTAHPSQTVWKSALAAAALIGLLIPAAATAATSANSSAYGEKVTLSLLPLLGGGVNVGSGPVPQVSGTAPAPYSQTNMLASASVSASLLGNILSTGVINVAAASTVPGTDQVSASAMVDNPQLAAVGNLQLVTLAASQITSSAAIGGTCGAALTTTGASVLTGAKLGGVLASGNLNANPAPNTQVVNIAGIRIVLNEQIAAGDGVSTASLTVNAVHVYVANAALTGLGVLSGDIVIGQSQAALNCGAAAPQSADLSITKSANPSPATAGQNLTYTITVANAGPDAADNVMVSDALPLGATFVSAAASQGSCSGTATVSCNLGTVSDGGSATVTIVVTPTVAGVLVNSATAGSTTTDPTPGNNTVSTSTTVSPAGGGSAADLSVAGSAAPSPVAVGSQLTYSIQVANTGPDGAGGVTVTDTLPAGVTLVSANASQGSCTGNPVVVCDLGTMASGGTATVTLAVTPTVPGVLVDTATVASGVPDPNSANNSAVFTTTVNVATGSNQADLSLTKSAAPNPVTVGSPLTYTLAVHNAGPSAAAGVVTTDVLPAAVTFVSATASQGSCSGTSTVVCSLGTLAAAADAHVNIVVLPTLAGALANSATVASSNPDPGPGNNTGTTTTTVNPAGGGGTAELTLVGSAAPNPVTVGNQLTYTILVKNSGPDGAGNVVVTDTLPAGVTFVSALTAQGSCTGTAVIVCNLGTVAVGSTVAITIAGTPKVAGTLIDLVTVASSTPDPAGNPSAQISTVVSAATGAAADLSITKSAQPSPVTVGSPLTYTLVVSNAGPSAATNVVATDSLPAGVSLLSSSAAQGSCTGTQVVSCNLGTVAAGGSVKITVVVMPTAAGTLVNHANVSSSNPDPIAGNNNATATTIVNPAAGGGTVTPADVSIVKTASPNPVAVGANLTYTLTVGNSGPSSATDVMATDNLPSGVTLVSTTPSQGTCSGTQTVSCSLGTLAAGATATVAIVVKPTVAGQLSNSASVAATNQDANPANNTSTVTVTVSAAGGGGTTAGGAVCAVEDVPAATLLIPYFAVDLSNANGMDTFFTVVNAGAAPRLASVTLWSDWAIPMLTFDIYLTGYGTQTFDLRQILATGNGPATGPGVDSAGGLSQANQSFPGCNADNVAGAGVRAAFLERALSGRKVRGGLCFASEKNTLLATGYVTVDTVNACSALNPSSAGYFVDGGTGIASDDNALLGDYYYSNPAANFAQGDNAVHLVANATTFTGNQYTFYARYVGGNGADNRQPLGSVYGVHYLSTGEFNTTDVTVWRDTKSPAVAPVACGSLPPWAPLGITESLVWDDQEHNSAIGPAANKLALATQLVSVGAADLPVAPQAGWMALDLSHAATSLFGSQAQGWVTVLHGSTSSPVTWSTRTWHLDTGCSVQ
jgi:uncharacterized repeat protein (TIGR01451 family)